MKIGKDKINLDGLNQLVKMLERENFTIKVGILGESSTRDGTGEAADDSGEIDNAGIGLVHEFGTENTPERSWLRMPLTEKFQGALEQSGAFDKKSLDKVIKEKSFLNFFKKIAIIAEETVQSAFDTGGFGKWKPSNFSLKDNAQTLVETQQLRRAVTSEVTSK